MKHPRHSAPLVKPHLGRPLPPPKLVRAPKLGVRRAQMRGRNV